jgi:hypothetical protein
MIKPIILFGLLQFSIVAGFASEPYAELKPDRVQQIEAMLPAQPAGFGKPMGDHAFWGSPATVAACGSAVADAEMLLSKIFPPWNDELYLDYSRTGRRPPGEKMITVRQAWLYPLVIAECLENKGRFLPPINHVLQSFAEQPTWTLPAHDWQLDNFHRKSYFVDLNASSFGADLAEALYLLGDRVDPAVRQQVIAALEERIFAPIRHSLITGEGTYYLGSQSQPVQNNWNAVCLAGVVGAARTILPDRHDRAMFLAAGEHYSQYYINSIGEDSYCDEGPGYWAYGFGHYAILRAILMDATGGRMDLFTNAKIQTIATYGVRIQLPGHLLPPFEDCRFGTLADTNLVSYCNQVLRLGIKGYENASAIIPDDLATIFLPVTPCAAATPGDSADSALPGLRSFFEDAGVLICRPAPGTTSKVSAAIKAGGNGSHSHNDIGSYVIAVGDEILAGDPGGPFAYNNKVFGPERFTYKLLNSFGHPVPVVAGRLQLDATKVHPRVLRTDFTPAADEIVMDLKPAYDVPELRELVRTMRFARTGGGAVVIEDHVVFSKPMGFEEGLPTLGKVKRVDARTFEFALGGEKIPVQVETPDGFKVTSERIEELDAPAFTRLGFQLSKPVTKATVKVTFQPVE